MKARWLAIVLAAASASAAAQVYRWTDPDGRVRYSDTPPPPGARNVEKKRVGVTAAERQQAASRELAAAIERFPVRLYSSPTCAAPCAAARESLNARGVPFREIPVWDDDTNEELKKLSGANEVPVLVVGTQALLKGFQPAEYEGALDAAGYPKRGALAPGAQAAPAPPEGYVPPAAREPQSAAEK